jgi:tRNA(Ile)-lysidine synthase
MIREKFNAYSEKYDMLPEGSRVLCACSGGADSTALLHLLCTTPSLTVACAHFNHRLRGAESDRDEAFVRELCGRLGIDCYCGREDVAAYAARKRIGLEQAAREMRYSFLEKTAEAHGFDRIATAHHAEDNAETVLLNLARGSAMRGLCGIPPVRGRIVRPLLTVTRDEIVQYLRENGLSFVEDGTNALDDCARNRIRHKVLPLLEKENTAAAEHICAAAELLRRDEEYLSSCAEDFIEMQQNGDWLSIAQFLELPEPVGTRVLRLAFGQVSGAHIAAVYALCRSKEPHAYADLPGRRLEKDGDRLLFRARSVCSIERRMIPEGETLLQEAGLRIIRRRVRPGEEIHNSFNTFFFQYDLIRGMIFVASRQPGDSIRLSGRGCTKTLKKLFSEAEIPIADRSMIPVLSDSDGVIAVAGFGVSERCAAKNAENAMCIEIKTLEA